MCRSLIVVAGLMALASLVRPAAGQIRPYTPPGGATLPGQLEYFRPQSGFLDQYNQFVAPRENLNNQLRAMNAQQTVEFQAVQNRMNQSNMVRKSEAAATGTSAGFTNYSHYYGYRGGGGGTAGRLVTPVRRYTPSVGGVGTGAGLVNGIGSGWGAGALELAADMGPDRQLAQTGQLAISLS